MGYNLDDHHAHSDLNTRTVQILNDKDRRPEDDFSPSALKRKAEAFKKNELDRQAERLQPLVDRIKKAAALCASHGQTQISTDLDNEADLIKPAADYFAARGFGTSITGVNLTLRW